VGSEDVREKRLWWKDRKKMCREGFLQKLRKMRRGMRGKKKKGCGRSDRSGGHKPQLVACFILKM
jgi:hypothetical protein